LPEDLNNKVNYYGRKQTLTPKEDKTDVNYTESSPRESTQCQNCVNIDEYNGCARVAGIVNDGGTCDLFEAQEV
jgi:hypothetical protein